MNLVKFFKTYRYECITAFSGGVVMILELVGARMIAPYFGTSTYVWTAMIGVILAALSIGYWYGGIMADKRADDRGLMQILAFAAGAIIVAVTIEESVLEQLAALPIDVRLQALMAASVIFAPAALLLGIISPYVAKLRLSSMATAGASIGRLYAAGTLGSIAGTFLAGYWLIAVFGNRTLGYLLVLVLIAVSYAATRRDWVWQRVLLAAVALFAIAFPPSLPANVVADVDSAYSRYQIVDGLYGLDRARMLKTDRFSIQSAQYVGQPYSLPLDYTTRFQKVLEQRDAERIVVIGGGVYTFPSVAALSHPALEVEAVEIDSALNGIAREYFGYQELPNLSVVNEDGRVFLSETPHHYDIIYLDAFSSLVPPFHLVTREYAELVSQKLSRGGTVVANVVGSPPHDPFLESMYATYRSTFRYVSIFPTAGLEQDGTKQNFLFVMSDVEDPAERYGKVLGVSPLEVASGTVLTDDFAPVEQLIGH